MPTETATFGLEVDPFDYTITWDIETPLVADVEINNTETGDTILIPFEALLHIVAGTADHINYVLRELKKPTPSEDK